MTLVAFTWNLNGSAPAFGLACSHLVRAVGRGDSVLASFQELPAGADRSMVERNTGAALRMLIEADGVTPKVALLVSRDLQPDAAGRTHTKNHHIDDNQRLEGRSLITSKGTAFQVLGVHGPDRINNPAERRAQLFRRVLEDFWSGGKLVVLGDFNASPFDWEITSRQGLHAARRVDRPHTDLKQPDRERFATALLNPMWATLNDPARPGSYRGRYESDLYWHCIDQVVVSYDLEQGIGVPRVLDRLHTRDGPDEPLVKGDGAPDETRYSDHLAVEVEIDMEGST